MNETKYSCPKCGGRLDVEREIEEYPFVCKECDENFYEFEAVETGGKSKPDNAHCPVCGSEDCEGLDFEVDFNYARQPCRCNDCGAEWNDEYKFTGCTDIWKEQLELEEV